MNLVRAGENLRFPKNFPWPLFRFGLKSPCNSNRFYQAWWALNGISKLSKISDHWSPSDQQPKNSHILKEDQDWQKHDGGEIQTDWDTCSHWCVGPATGTLLRGMDSLIDMPGPATGKWGIFYFGEASGPATEEFPHSQGGSKLPKTQWGWNPNGLREISGVVRIGCCAYTKFTERETTIRERADVKRKKYLDSTLHLRTKMAINVDLTDPMLKASILNQCELARKSGLSDSVVHGYATNKVKAVNLDTLDRLCSALKCQPGDILQWKSNSS